MELSRQGVSVVLFNPGDNPGGTPLCSGQEEHYREMEEHLSKSCRDFDTFRDYFQACRYVLLYKRVSTCHPQANRCR